MDKDQRVSVAEFNPFAGIADTTSLPHDQAEIRHREAQALCLAAGWIDAARYHMWVADWHAAGARRIARRVGEQQMG